MSSEGAGFASTDERADVAVIAVTYNSSTDIDPFISSLRAEGSGLRLRVIVADNRSSDDTVDKLRRHGDVVVVDTGGNRGYAGGLNAAAEHVGAAASVLVLNPDLTVEPGSIGILVSALDQAGLVVPKLLDDDDTVYTSLRREPSLSRALGDAVFGSRNPRRHPALSEIELRPERYGESHEIEWATGAAVLIRQDVADLLGDWDERFFLYSEETDFFRRARTHGIRVVFEPAAVMRHSRGGSGSSAKLDALMAVNRVRYVRKHHGVVYSTVFHGVVLVHELARSYSSRHRAILRILMSPRRWRELCPAD